MENNKKQRIAGCPCPKCGGFVPISMIQLIESTAIYCPECGLRLNINKTESSRALKALQKIKEAEKNIQK